MERNIHEHDDAKILPINANYYSLLHYEGLTRHYVPYRIKIPSTLILIRILSMLHLSLGSTPERLDLSSTGTSRWIARFHTQTESTIRSRRSAWCGTSKSESCCRRLRGWSCTSVNRSWATETKRRLSRGSGSPSTSESECRRGGGCSGRSGSGLSKSKRRRGCRCRSTETGRCCRGVTGASKSETEATGWRGRCSRLGSGTERIRSRSSGWCCTTGTETE
jgi:hypothetical protein